LATSTRSAAARAPTRCSSLLQVCALVSESLTPRNIHVFPFALGGSGSMASFEPVANPNCRIGCSASSEKV